MSLRDDRSAPFAWVSMHALKEIRHKLPTKSQAPARNALFALAEAASDRYDGKHREGDTLRDLAGRAGTSTRRLRDQLAALADIGLVKVEKRVDSSGRDLPTVYVLANDSGGDTKSYRGDDLDAQTSDPTRARPSQPSAAQAVIQTAEKKEKKDARSKTSYRGKAVADRTVNDAETLLTLFNALLSRRLSARDANDRASPHLTQIIGALQANPDATLSEWERGMRRAVLAPPDWAKGRALQLGDIFGPSAAAHTLTPATAQIVAARSNGRAQTGGDLLAASLARRRAEANTIEGTAHDVH